MGLHGEMVCFGGVLDGRTVESDGYRLLVPVVTPDYVRAYGAWIDTYGLAWNAETWDGIPEHPVTPPPPDMPTEEYRPQRVGGEWVCLLWSPAQ